jgi:CheY-like chemotaxis protein
MALAERRSAMRNSRVLVASSSESFRRLWAAKPEYETVEMEVVAGGADALEKLESEDWGEVLLDRHLHDLDADEVLQIIRGRDPHLLVRVVDSALDQAEAGNAAGSRGADLSSPLLPSSDFDLSEPFGAPLLHSQTSRGKLPKLRRVSNLCRDDGQRAGSGTNLSIGAAA